jgi:hypothetical protein
MVLPFGVITIRLGSLPTGIAVSGRLDETRIGVTEFEPVFATYTVLPLGVTRRENGSLPTTIAGSAVLVAVSIGITKPAVKGT